MIQLKNHEQIALMREAGRITGEALAVAGERVREGVTTKHLDDVIRAHIEKRGASPSFLGYAGFPASACVSVNDEVIHGIPSPDRVLLEGDIVKIDVGAFYRGFHGDSAATFAVGKISPQAEKLIEVTKECFYRALAQIKVDARIGDIGNAVDQHAKAFGFSAVQKYVGHGVGRELHEPPDIPNYGTPGRGLRISNGMTFAVEPMINAGSHEVKEDPDRWTVRTADGSLSAHYEHTIAVVDGEAVLLTLP